MPQTHRLKTWPNYFDAIQRREKRFDVRRDDRGFQKGDSCIFIKFDPVKGRAERRDTDNSEIIFHAKIKYILTGGQFGIEPGFVVLGL